MKEHELTKPENCTSKKYAGNQNYISGLASFGIKE